MQPIGAALAAGTVIADRYRLERLLGSGGFGSIHAATDLQDGTLVALKLLETEALAQVGGEARFRREAELVRRLEHPNLVRVLGEGCDAGGSLYIVFELLEGRSLYDELERWGAMQQSRAARIATCVLDGLEEAHGHGVIHRDLKSTNVFLLSDGDVVKVLDFGIATSTNPGTVVGLTAAGVRLGTPAYMAPEQITGAPLGPQTDLFALGVMLLEMLLGTLPYPANVDPMDLVRERLTGQRVPLPESVRGLALGQVVARATEPHMQQRYASAAEMRDAIREAIGTSPSPDSVITSSAHASSGMLSRSDAFAPTAGFASVPEPAPPGPSAPIGPAAGAPPGLTPHSPPGPAPQAPAGFGPHAPPGFAPHAPPDWTAVSQPAWGSSAQPTAQPAWSATGANAPGYTMPAVWSPSAGAQPWAASPRPAPQGKGGALVAGLVVGGFLLCAGGGVGIYLYSSAASDGDSSDRSEADSGPAPKPRDDQPERVPSPPVPDPAPGRPGPDPSPGAARVRACPNARGVQMASLTSALRASGWSTTGKLLYCPGDMVNFRCVGVSGDGLTAEKGGQEGSVALLRFQSAAAADAYVARETGTVTLANASPVVVRIEMPEPEADLLLARICR